MSASSWLSPLPKGPCNSPRGSTSLFLLLVSLLPHLLYHSRLLQKTQGPSQHSPGVWTLQSCPTLGWQVSQHALGLLTLQVHSRHVAVGDRGSHMTPALQRVMNHSQGGPGTGAPQQQQSKETSWWNFSWSAGPREGLLDTPEAVQCLLSPGHSIASERKQINPFYLKHLLSTTLALPQVGQDHFIYCLKSLMEIEKSPRSSLKCAVGTSGKTKFITGTTKTILLWVVGNQFGAAVTALQCLLFFYKNCFSQFSSSPISNHLFCWVCIGLTVFMSLSFTAWLLSLLKDSW